MTDKPNNHYYKDVTKYKQLDVYRVLKLFNVTDQNIGHAVKKLLAPGCRSGGKSFEQDIIDARDSLNRLLEMIEEDKQIKIEAGRISDEHINSIPVTKLDGSVVNVKEPSGAFYPFECYKPLTGMKK